MDYEPQEWNSRVGAAITWIAGIAICIEVIAQIAMKVGALR